MNRFGVTVLCILDEKYHEERHNRRSGIDDELPGIGIVVIGAQDAPDNDDHDCNDEDRRSAYQLGGFVGKPSECVFHMM